MADKIIKLPDIGDFESIDIIEIPVSPGDSVNIDDTLITLESNKATMDIPSPSVGIIKEIKVNVGDKISEGTDILVLEESAEESTEDSVEENSKIIEPEPVSEQSAKIEVNRDIHG